MLLVSVAFFSFEPVQLAFAQAPYTTEIHEASAAIKALERKKKKLEKDYSSTEKALKRLESALSKTQSHLRTTQSDLQQQQQALSALQADIEQTNEQMTQEETALKQQLRAAYQQGVPQPLELILSEQQPGTWDQIAVYHRSIIAARDRRFNHLLALRARKQSQEEQLQTITQTLASQEADAKAAITRLSRLRQEQKKIAKTLRHEQSSTGSSLASLRKEHQQLEALLAAWKSRQSTSQPFAQYKGKLNWPVKGKLSAFEDPSSNNGRKGVFIAAKAGTAVKAVHGGQIIFSDWLRGFGMMCIIDHGNGYLSLYGQNDSLTHQAGKYVQSGDQIGTVGRSGGQTTSGVYFELRHNGKPTNAQHWLARSTP